MNKLLLWFKTQVLKKVVYGEDGLPIDVRGLKVKGKPFTESSEYYIQDDYDSRWNYIGNGVYWKISGSMQTDMDNPYWKDKFLKQCTDAKLMKERRI